MAALSEAIRQLQGERSAVEQELKRIDKALSLLRQLARSKGSPQPIAANRRRISAAGRKRISDAQKARWAKARKAS